MDFLFIKTLSHLRHFSLRHNEIIVNAVLFDQLVVCADLGNSALIQYNQTGCVSECGETVRDGDGRALVRKLRQGFLDLLFGFRVERSGCSNYTLIATLLKIISTLDGLQ